MNSGVRMPGARHCPRINTFELKLQIERKIGRQRAEMYFNLLTRYLSSKLSKSEFDKLCVGLVGRENISVHNSLIQAIIRNACVAKTPPQKYSKTEASLNGKVRNGYQISSLQSLCRDVFTQSPRKGRTPTLRDRKFKDRPSPLGPHGKSHNLVCEDSVPKVQEQQSATELLSLGSRPPVEVHSVEDGEEVEQAAGSPGIYSRSPLTAPLGISLNNRGTRKVLSHGPTSFLCTETCHFTSELPDMNSLKQRLEKKLEVDGLNVSTDCINLLNNGLDAYLKRLIKSCLHLAASRSEQKHHNQVYHQGVSVPNGMRPMTYVQRSSKSVALSMLDFRAAMELYPRLLGEDWPVQLEKLSLHASEESKDH
ncbi:hypothetical protein ACH5RR_013984 [Cinchona calisaya]|uniref:Transcriptional coactivator Hfi1/Transcriptional adapter 1 n=1 Tax=Cinchona calisaya TaxID=153742 RepID=A0ABD3A1M3_9GENT